MTWLAEHESFVAAFLALFGAGGAGAIVVQWLLRRRDAKGNEPNIQTTADRGGIAATHGGRGDISITNNEAVSHRTLEAWRTRLALSRVSAGRLFEACARAGLTPAEISRLGLEFDKAGELAAAPNWSHLHDALEDEDIDRAADLVRSLCQEVMKNES